MKKAAIISIGSELMKGKMDDTNSTFIARWLHSRGILVEWRMNVGDSIEKISNVLEYVKSADIVVATGGLGPAGDDCTREAFARYLKKDLVFNQEAWKEVKRFYVLNKLKIPASNKRQAMKIAGSAIIPNRAGTAPGVYFKENNKAYVLLPGPPSENQPMIERYLASKLTEDNFIDGTICTDIFRIYNTGESNIADLFQPVKSGCDLGYYFSQEGWIEIHVSRYSKNAEESRSMVKETANKLKNLLTRNNYFYTENQDLGQILLNLFKVKGLTLSFAESITGGSLSGEFIKNSGASDVIAGSVVAYSNEVKKKVLGVKEETLAKYGAVSEECAAEMDTGLNKIMQTDVSVAVSGIAGPAGGSRHKPVGTVCFGFNIKGKIYTKKEHFIGNRSRVIKRSINYTFIELIKSINH